MLRRESPSSLKSLVEFLTCDLILFNEERDLSAVEFETGNVVKMRRRVLIFGRNAPLQTKNESIAEDGFSSLLVFPTSLQQRKLRI